jgi:hypothetical protein
MMLQLRPEPTLAHSPANDLCHPHHLSQLPYPPLKMKKLPTNHYLGEILNTLPSLGTRMMLKWGIPTAKMDRMMMEV